MQKPHRLLGHHHRGSHHPTWASQTHPVCPKQNSGFCRVLPGSTAPNPTPPNFRKWNDHLPRFSSLAPSWIPAPLLPSSRSSSNLFGFISESIPNPTDFPYLNSCHLGPSPPHCSPEPHRSLLRASLLALALLRPLPIKQPNHGFKKQKSNLFLLQLC